MKSPHDIRRTVLTNLDQAEVPISAISKIAGHSSQKQTEDYLRVTEQRMAEHDYTELLVPSSLKSDKIIPFRRRA